MGLEQLKGIIATSGSICSILQFLVGMLVCRKYIQNGTTGDASPITFIACFLSSCLWLLYGLVISDLSVILVNSVGAVLQLAYVIVFYFYCLKKTLVLKQMSAALVILTLVFVYLGYEKNPEVAKSRIGFVCVIMTIFFFAAPLTSLAHVIQIKSAESLPFPIILMTFVTSVQWLIYGIILKDPYMQIPNILGTILSLFQLSLFVIYPSRPEGPS